MRGHERLHARRLCILLRQPSKYLLVTSKIRNSNRTPNHL